MTVLVVTARALKMHGGMPEEEAVKKGDDQDALKALEKGFANLDRHVKNLQGFGVPVLIAINRFPGDTEKELKLIKKHAQDIGVRAELSEGVAKGGEGTIDLAKAALDIIQNTPSNFKPLYDLKLSLREKLEALAKYYGADGIELEGTAESDIRKLEELEQSGALKELGLSIYDMPINMAKTQYSFTHDPDILGAPTGWRLKIRELTISSGAGFIVAKTGAMMLMPGWPKQPRAELIRTIDKSDIIPAKNVLSNL